MIIEEIEVLKGHPVTNMLVVDEQIIVVFQSEIHSLPLERCLRALSCRDCVNLRDPHCAWVDRRCVASVMDNGCVITVHDVNRHESVAHSLSFSERHRGTALLFKISKPVLMYGALLVRWYFELVVTGSHVNGKSAGPTLLSTPMIQGEHCFPEMATCQAVLGKQSFDSAKWLYSFSCLIKK